MQCSTACCISPKSTACELLIESFTLMLAYLLDLWDAEEKSRQKNLDNVVDVDDDTTDLKMFNDRQWKDQWYMVSLTNWITLAFAYS